MTRIVSSLLLLLLLGALGVVVVHALRTRAIAGKDMPAYSVYSRKETDGLATAAWLLRQEGWEPVALTRPIQHTRHRGLLLLIEPQRTAPLPGQEPELPEADVKGLLRWVEQGNTLLFASRHTTALHRELGVLLTTDLRVVEGEVQRVEVSEAGGYTVEVDQVEVETRQTLQPGPGLPLWWVGEQPGAVLLRRGQGRVLVLADPGLLTEKRLGRDDNALVLLNVVRLHAQAGKVLFDEYHHGLRSGGGFWGYLHYHEQHGLVLQVLLVAGIALWARAVRLGPATPRPRGRQADAVDYASALARIYERAGVRRLLAQTLVRGFLAALTRQLRLRRNAAPAEILAAWRRRDPRRPAEEVQTLLNGIDELRTGTNLTDRHLWGWAKTLDRFEREVLRER